ncbi:hypothetical protein [Nocardioides iriomotensis]|uniref:Uncharacterized protein n=1 Tax=Nocardioides iriomotensis TaxID=715784 RepID=A0A4Q5IY98_9ACTN|nr:hypothetical protein [Nocardioides iriomotensis]RYU09969.1 hypothetical protein ETU37_19230 [Nocardioides iriomotensis]
MTHDDLRELLRDHVEDVTGPDLADVAWKRARGIRRRRAATTVAAVAVVAVLLGTALGRPGDERATEPVAPSPAPSPTVTRESTPAPPYDSSRGSQPDGEEDGWSVFRGPTAEQETALPLVESPLPTEIDLGAPAAPLEDDPVEAALAAYAITREDGSIELLLLADDGSLRSVDVSDVQPLSDGGLDVSIARETLLSPTGRFLAIPQEGSVLVLTLATGDWRTIDTGTAPTAWVSWLGESDLYLPPARLGGQGPTYSALDGTRNGSNGFVVPTGPFDPATGVPIGRSRQGPLGTAQTWASVAVPGPDTPPVPSRVVVVDGFTRADDALLVLGETNTSERPDSCCSVAFWLDGERIVYESQTDPRRLVAWRVRTHELGTVATITGIVPGQRVVSSYVRVWDRSPGS